MLTGQPVGKVASPFPLKTLIRHSYKPKHQSSNIVLNLSSVQPLSSFPPMLYFILHVPAPSNGVQVHTHTHITARVTHTSLEYDLDGHIKGFC